MKKFSLFLLVLMIMSSFVVSIEAAEFQPMTYNIPKTATPPTIDGVMNADEWKGALCYSMSSETVDFDYSTPTPGTFTEAAFYFMWDDNNFYWAAVVDDPTVATSIPSFGALRDYYKTDGVHIQLYATDNEKTSSSYNLPDSIWIGAVPQTKSNKPSMYVEWGLGEDTEIANKMYGGAVGATMTSDSAYVIEIQVPWKIFKRCEDNGWSSDISGIAGQSMKIEPIIWEVEGSGTAKRFVAGKFRIPAITDIFVLSEDSVGGVVTEPVADETTATATDTLGDETTAPDAETTDAPVSSNDKDNTGTIVIIISVAVIVIAIAAAAVILKKKK